MIRDFRLRLKPEELRKLYLVEKKSLEDIAKLYGVSRVAVWKYCKDELLSRRGRSEARLEAQKKGIVSQRFYDINERFFRVWSSEMAYVLGLIVTDGCISRSGTVALCINDKDLLETVKKAMASEHEIKYYGYQEGLYNFKFSRQILTEDLSRLGIFPDKSLTIKFPDIPDAFLVDFIRGVFDGDGSVFYEKRSYACPLRASFVGSSKDFMESLEFKLRVLGMAERRIYQHKTKNAVSYMIRYAHGDSIRLFKILYNDDSIKKRLFLSRKYDKFLSGITCGRMDGSVSDQA